MIRKIATYGLLALFGGMALIAAIYAVNALSAFLVMAGLTVAVLLVAWILLGRLWDFLRHGKPIFRSGSAGSSDTNPSRPSGNVLDDEMVITNDRDRGEIQKARKLLEELED